MNKTVICCVGCGCKNTTANPVKRYRTLAYSRYDYTEGRPLYKEVSQIDVDLCQKCARKATNVEDTSCMSLSIRIDDVRHNGI